MRAGRQLRCVGIAGFSLSHLCRASAPSGLIDGLIWPQAGFASIAFAAMAPIDFLPLTAAPSFLAEQESLTAAILRCASACAQVRRRSPRPSDRHRGRKGAGSRQRSRRTIMATIGTFKKSGNEFVGEIVTLSVQAKNVRIVPEANRSGENAPSHRVFVGRAEIGAAWAKRSNEGRDYLGLKLDDPSFTAPIYANLFDDEDGDGYSLIWSRPNRRNSE